MPARSSLLVLACLLAGGGAPAQAVQETATAPARAATSPPDPACPQDPDIRLLCGKAAPEDLIVLPGGRWVLVSSLRGEEGGLRAVDIEDYSLRTLYPVAEQQERFEAEAYPGCPGPLVAADRATFVTHGLALREGEDGVHTVYTVHHGSRESVEVFELDMRGEVPALTWIGCAVAPAGTGLNSVAPLPDGGFVSTNMMPRGEAGRAMFPNLRQGQITGELLEWQADSGWAEVPGTEGSGVNGVVVSEDGDTLYLAEWGRQMFVRVDRSGSQPRRDVVPLGFRADNLRWAPDGSILLAGQGDEGTSEVVRIDPATLAVTELVNRPDTANFEAGTVAIEHDGAIWVGSYRSNSIALFPVAR